MAATPKEKVSKSKTRQRRSHNALKTLAGSSCAKCGTTKRPHRACPKCGDY
ncbi:50S ribosomal protein L32 [candidate division WWE3 bacterium CG08_land_8_20_14_0_20_43_13]|uniref:Large ribosomal subunit protein bL32 n=1 Tax=candidate division WWE3 bacterium CG08_land_8_20_14_0_20_43_13 TaxID=1975087 RepID=A0A2H0X834_UNCKA|nr:MAG: 50S ribosomal protein L32 [candidate division WWE3 bacterium CG08_land_8_20_14_0_20_43_13]